MRETPSDLILLFILRFERNFRCAVEDTTGNVMAQIVPGCSGYRYYRPPEGWKEKYVQKIQAYSDEYPLLELNSSFYKLPMKRTAQKWRKLVDEVNSDFRFVVKANQRITHEPSSPTYDKGGIEVEEGKVDNYGSFRPTEEVFDAWLETKAICEELAADICLLQTPSSFEPSDEHLSNLSNFLEGTDADFSLALETRGAEWTDDIISDLCDEYKLVNVVDPLKSETLKIDNVDLKYFRLHGLGSQKYRYKFTNDDLKRLYEKCEEYANQMVYVLFNNYEMHNDCRRFVQYLRENEFPEVSWGADAVMAEIDVQYPITKDEILSKCGDWWVWIKPDESIKVREVFDTIEERDFASENELLASLQSTFFDK
ncbi:MAG: DUF72 domain-containing protein [Candidatus Thorarchaeota archaeon]